MTIQEQIVALRNMEEEHRYSFPEAIQAADTMTKMNRVVEAAQAITDSPSHAQWNIEKWKALNKALADLTPND